MKLPILKRSILSALLILFTLAARGQHSQPKFLSLVPADSLHKTRLWATTGFGTALYGVSMIGLYQSWYADYPVSKFHLFNDNGEWNQMDKMGHWLMSYNEAKWTYMGANWTGMKPRTAAWVGFAGGQLIQTSFEIFDGFSEQWGFSLGDIAFNTLGSGMFLAQQLGWQEQRILMKMSAMPVKYSDEKIYPYFPEGNQEWTTLKQRADALYGTSPLDLFLKNYNTLVVWSSVNIRSFMPKDQNTWVPRWLNVAVGMGADNLYAGFGYDWEQEKGCDNCPKYRVDPNKYPRTRQFFLSLDVDTSKIRVKNRFLRTLLQAGTIFKIPAPTLEYNSRGKFIFHPIYF